MNEDLLKIIMSEIFKTDISNISTSTSQKTLSSWDSLAHLNLIIELEMKFDVDFEPDEISHMNSYESIKSVLKEKLG